jgi:hypothetical protein
METSSVSTLPNGDRDITAWRIVHLALLAVAALSFSKGFSTAIQTGAEGLFVPELQPWLNTAGPARRDIFIFCRPDGPRIDPHFFSLRSYRLPWATYLCSLDLVPSPTWGKKHWLGRFVFCGLRDVAVPADTGGRYRLPGHLRSYYHACSRHRRALQSLFLCHALRTIRTVLP